MKKYLFLFAFIVCCMSVYAQSNKDVVYLKNGSVIHGTVLEQNYVDDRIKVKTNDGSVFVYRITEVELIKKEEQNEGFRGGNGLHSKFRVIIETGYVFGIKNKSYKEDRVGGSISFGYQFNPYIYLGAGAAGYYYVDSKVGSLPIFLNFRTDFINAKICPFVDIKGGYSPMKNVEGAYASVGVGCRFRLGKSFALSVSTGSEYQSAEVRTSWSRKTRQDLLGAYAKVGIDF